MLVTFLFCSISSLLFGYHRQILVALVLFAIFILPIKCLGQPKATDSLDSIYLPMIDSLRVLLFQKQSPTQFTIYAHNGPILLTGSGSFRRTMSEIEPGISIKMDNKNLLLNDAAHSIPLHQLIIRNSEESLIRIKIPGLSYRYYKGRLEITFNQHGQVRFINHVGLENYIGSVIGGEMNFGNFEALKAQAVVSRSYALWNLPQIRAKFYDLTDHSLNQIYQGELITKPIYQKAAAATHGEILTWNNRIILAAYSSTCGGVTASNETVWNGHPLPYLRAVKTNDACRESPHFTWTSTVPKNELHSAISHTINARVQSINVNQKDNYGRVITLGLQLSKDKKENMSANQFRMAVSSYFDEYTLKSTYFTLNSSKSGNKYIMNGHGMGHGVGLCQWGASGLAKSGWKYKEILKFYYNGVEIINYHFFNSKHISRAN